MNIICATYRVGRSAAKGFVFGTERHLPVINALEILGDHWLRFLLNLMGYEVRSYDVSTDTLIWEYFYRQSPCAETTKDLMTNNHQQKFGFFVRRHA